MLLKKLSIKNILSKKKSSESGHAAADPSTDKSLTPYQLLGGEQGVRQLTVEFYKAMDELPEANTIRAMHGEDLSHIQELLFQYLSGWLGGPPLYKEKHGTVCLTSPHKPYKIGEAERDQWLLCMEKALERINASDQVKSMLNQPFYNLVNFMINARETS